MILVKTMKPESKKTIEKKRIQIKDDCDSSFDLSSLKEAINNASEKPLLEKTNVTTKKKDTFDLTSMSHALPSVKRYECDKRRRHVMKRRIKTPAVKESNEQHFRSFMNYMLQQMYYEKQKKLVY